MTKFDQSQPSQRTTQIPASLPPRFTLDVPASWPHAGGPLHGLLEFQDAKCAICGTAATWSTQDNDTLDPAEAFESETPVASSSMKQWIDAETQLLYGLVCARCCRRYKTMGVTPDGAAVNGLPDFLRDPPGQRFSHTIGLGPQSRPRRLNSRVAPTEVPAPAIWSYYGTVIHSLFLWQRGRCAICSTGLLVTTHPKTVHVDHDPDTDLIRGLLCQRDNIALGQKTWPREWWEHLAPMVDAYEDHPPAQTFPATRGLRMAQRTRGAHITSSADNKEILMDGMPMSISHPTTETRQDPPPPGDTWYAVHYTDTAPTGYPPVVQAARCITYSDTEGSWYAFLMNPPLNTSRAQPHCVLRVKVGDVTELTEHTSLEDALAASN